MDLRETPPLSRLEKSLFALAAAFYAVFIWRNAFWVDGALYFTLFDDAMISMHFAQNLAHGHGLVWNPGEAPVEGYTNFLWTLWMSALHLLPVATPNVSLLVMLSSALSLLVNGVVVRRIAALLSGGDPFTMLGALTLTLFCYPIIYWSLIGMEVGILSLFICTATLLSLQIGREPTGRRLAALALVLALALLTRSDAVLPTGIIIIGTILGSAREKRIKVALVLLGSAGLTLALHTGFRLAYYHYPLPNTYYLKVHGTPLADRLAVGSVALLRTLSFELWVLLLVPALVSWVERNRRRDLRWLMIYGVFAAQAAYSVYVGGDAWEFNRTANRYIAIALPLGGVAFFSAIGDLLRSKDTARIRPVARLLVAGAAANMLVLSFAHWIVPDTPFFVWGKWIYVYLLVQAGVLMVGVQALRLAKKGELGPNTLIWIGAVALVLYGETFGYWAREGLNDIDHEMARLGVDLERFTKPGARIGVTWAGGPMYFSHRLGVDLLGKCDGFIARLASTPGLSFIPGHSKWNLRYSLETYKPDVIIQSVGVEKEEWPLLKRLGYVRLPNGFYALRDSQLIDRQKVGALPYQMRWFDPYHALRPTPVTKPADLD